MRTDFQQTQRHGFTLTELAVIVVIIVILVIITPPAVYTALIRGRLTAAVSAGKSIHNFVFSQSLTDIYDVAGDGSGWPRYGSTQVTNNQFQTSTEYFVNMVTSGTMTVNFSFFAPYGVRPAQGGYQNFQHTNNGWCMVGDVDKQYPDDAPLLFTKNLAGFTRMDTPLTEERFNRPALLREDEGAPFGGCWAFVFITKGGSGYTLYGPMLNVREFTNTFSQTDVGGNKLTNQVIRP